MVDQRIGDTLGIVADFAAVERRPHALHDIRTDVGGLFRGPLRGLQQLGIVGKLDPICRHRCGTWGGPGSDRSRRSADTVKRHVEKICPRSVDFHVVLLAARRRTRPEQSAQSE
jgi:hypothetical protein